MGNSKSMIPYVLYSNVRATYVPENVAQFQSLRNKSNIYIYKIFRKMEQFVMTMYHVQSVEYFSTKCT